MKPSPSSWKSKLTLLLVSSLTIMSIITISPALPGMVAAFPDNENAEFIVKIILTIPALFIAISSPIAGRLIDRHGRLRLLWFAIILYAVSGTAGYYLQDLISILVSRILLGVAVGISMTIVITLVADYYEGMERQKFIGLQVAFMSLGGIFFIGLGGILADISWRVPFLIYIFALLVLPLTFFYLREPVIEKIQSDITSDVKAPGIIWLLFINTMIMWILFFLIPVQIPFHLNGIGVEKNALIGGAIAMSTAASAVSSISFSKIKGRFNFLTIFVVGYLLMGLGFAFVSISTAYLHVVIGMILCGFGIGVMIPNTNMWVMKLAPPAIRGKEIGKLTTFWFLGQFLSPFIFFPLLKVQSLSSTFMITTGVLFFLSLGFMIFNFSKMGREAIK